MVIGKKEIVGRKDERNEKDERVEIKNQSGNRRLEEEESEE